MIESSLLVTWNDIWQEKDRPIELVDNIWNEIKKAYSSNGRYYHNLNHTGDMIKSSIAYADKIEDIKTVQLAIFYHDVVYSSKRNDNEEMSAKLATDHLIKLNFPAQKIEKCCNYIIATKGHVGLIDQTDLNYFLDFDLQKLGSCWDEYVEYSGQIRLEYLFYPDIVYKPGRKKVLEHFLKLEKIYKSPEFIDLYEKQARSNLLMEMELLG